MDAAARALPALYASPAATCNSQIAVIPVCASILEAMPPGKLSSRIIVRTLRDSGLKYCYGPPHLSHFNNAKPPLRRFNSSGFDSKMVKILN